MFLLMTRGITIKGTAIWRMPSATGLNESSNVLKNLLMLSSYNHFCHELGYNFSLDTELNRVLKG